MSPSRGASASDLNPKVETSTDVKANLRSSSALTSAKRNLHYLFVPNNASTPHPAHLRTRALLRSLRFIGVFVFWRIVRYAKYALVGSIVAAIGASAIGGVVSGAAFVLAPPTLAGSLGIGAIWAVGKWGFRKMRVGEKIGVDARLETKRAREGIWEDGEEVQDHRNDAERPRSAFKFLNEAFAVHKFSRALEPELADTEAFSSRRFMMSDISDVLSAKSSPSIMFFKKVYTYLPLILPILLLLHVLRNRYSTPLRRYPGPLLASFSRVYQVCLVASGKAHHHMFNLHAQYGPIVRIGPNELSFSSPEAARQLLSAGKGFHKTQFYGVFPPPDNPDIFTETREDVHARKKRVANVPYSMGAMQQLTPFIDETIHLLLTKLDQCGVKVDLGDWLHFFAFDVLGEVAFSRKFGFLDEGIDVEGAIRTIDNSQWYNGIVGQIPGLDFLLKRNPLWKLMPAFNPGNTIITKMASAEMESRKPFLKEKEPLSSTDRKDLLQSLIEGHVKSPDKFGEGDVFAVAHGAIFAGSDSTASTMQSFFWHALHDPRVYSALEAEILAASITGTLSPNITWAEAQQLPYFQACLKEAMRIRPAVGLNITRLIPAGGAEIDGTWLPGGTTVAVNGLVLHRDRTIFGEDADVYRPERWLEKGEQAKKMGKYMFQFGGGSHLCIGRNLAVLEMNKVLPRLIRDYCLRLVNADLPLEENCTFFVVQSGLELWIERRRGVEERV